MNSNNEVIYVRTPSYYGMELAREHFTLNKIYKATKVNLNKPTCYLYEVIDDINETRTILVNGCAWLHSNSWEVINENDYIYQELTMNSKKLTRAECLREHARVIEMCEGTDVDSRKCIRVDGIANNCFHLGFSNPNREYTFAIRILEGKPVFEGDTLYGTTEYTFGQEFKAAAYWCESSWDMVAWTKPEIKKTCNLNGTELPLADGNFLDYGLNIEVYYRNKEDRDKVREVITKLLKGE